MRHVIVPGALLLIVGTAAAQSSIAACGPLPDSTSRQVVRDFGSMRVCLLATKVTDPEANMPVDWAARGATVILETQRPDDNRRAVIEGNRVAWMINGRPAPLDSLAERWQKAVIDLLDVSFEADALRQQDVALRAQADSLPNKREAMRIRIASIERFQLQLDQQMAAERSRETAHRNEIQRLEAQRNDIQRRASAEERRAAGLTDERARAAADANIRRYYSDIQRLDDQIRRAEKDTGSDGSMRIAALEEQLRSLHSGNNLALLRMQLANYNSTSVDEIEAQITQLGARQRLPVLEAQVEKSRLALLAILEARGKAPSR